jgi:hypothetical protein
MNSPAVTAALDELINAIRSELKQQFLDALGGGGGSKKASGTRRRMPARRATPAKGGKRSAQDLAALTSSVLTYIRRHPASRVEQIAAGLGTSTKELALPINKLWDAGMLKIEGQRRGMKYSAK